MFEKESTNKKNNPRKKPKNVKTLEEELLTVSINTVKRADLIINIIPKIERKYLKMELDTGSALSVIPIKMYRQLFSHRPLSTANTTLRTYSEQIIKPARIIHVNVKYENQEHNLDLFVVKNNSPALFGRSSILYYC